MIIRLIGALYLLIGLAIAFSIDSFEMAKETPYDKKPHQISVWQARAATYAMSVFWLPLFLPVIQKGIQCWTIWIILYFHVHKLKRACRKQAEGDPHLRMLLIRLEDYLYATRPYTKERAPADETDARKGDNDEPARRRATSQQH